MYQAPAIVSELVEAVQALEAAEDARPFRSVDAEKNRFVELARRLARALDDDKAVLGIVGRRHRCGAVARRSDGGGFYCDPDEGGCGSIFRPIAARLVG